MANNPLFGFALCIKVARGYLILDIWQFVVNIVLHIQSDLFALLFSEFILKINPGVLSLLFQWHATDSRKVYLKCLCTESSFLICLVCFKCSVGKRDRLPGRYLQSWVFCMWQLLWQLRGNDQNPFRRNLGLSAQFLGTWRLAFVAISGQITKLCHFGSSDFNTALFIIAKSLFITYLHWYLPTDIDW